MRTPGPAFDLRAALSEELRAAQSHLEALPLDPKSVHQCRVRIKRARALARVGGVCAPGLSEVFLDAARGLMRNLARARDPAALAQAARLTARKCGKRKSAALNRIAEQIETTSNAAQSMNLDAARAGLKDLLALAQVWPEASSRQIRKGALKLDQRARAARNAGIASDDQRLRHRWRGREKDRYYAADILGDAWPGKRRRQTAEKIAAKLGDERDSLLLIEKLAAEGAASVESKSAKRAFNALNRRRAKSARRADALAARLC